MILVLFTVLLLLSLFLIPIGRYVEAPVIEVVAYGFIFILGSLVLTNSLEYPTGSDITINSSLSNYQVVNVTKSYANFDTADAKSFGLFLCAMGIFGFVSLMANLKPVVFKDAFERFRK